MYRNVKDLIEAFESNKLVPKEGALKIYNIWFGRPYDNLHKISSINFIEIANILEFYFDEGEKLSLWNPKGLEVSSSCFKIKNASKVMWEWHLYGEDKIDVNKRYWLLKPSLGFIINITSNDDYLKSGVRLKPYANALEIL